jgi:luciferase family oxidoreductase group 1
MGLVLGVLDQSPVSDGASGSDALQNTIDLARLADRLGYHRYWLAEHHGTPMVAGTSPEVLAAAVASTTRLRVGSAGVMLPHYSPLKVAESFSVLSGLFPGRIDLGIGRAPGTDRETMWALQRDRTHPAPYDFPEQLAELLAYLNDDFPAGHRFAHLAALPGRPEKPELWLLGSSRQSALWAAELGLNYAFADFIYPGGAGFAHTYRRRFSASAELHEPRVAVSVAAICAETDDEAEHIAISQRAVFHLFSFGRLIPVPPPEEARRILDDLGVDPQAPPPGRRVIVGNPDTVRFGIEQVAEEYGADEVVVVTITFDHAARRRSYELIADAFALAGAEPAEATSLDAPRGRSG